MPKQPYMKLDGMIYGPGFTNGILNGVINLRDEALKKGDMQASVVLSHTIVVLNDYIKRIQE